MNQTIVSKIRVYNPNKKGSAKANRGYCNYIATRPGVVITDVDYAPGQEERYLKMSNNADYVDYIAKRPRSHGLFGNIDTSNLSQINKTIEDYSRSNKIIYRGILSLTEQDASDLGYFSVKKWESLLSSSMSDIGNVFNIPVDRLQWIGAFHFEQGHPHVHYMFWDTKEKIMSPYIHVSKQQKCREIFSNQVFKEERQLEIIEKTAKRDLIIEYGKSIMNDTTDYLHSLFLDEKVTKKIPGRVNSEYIESISRQLLSLSNNLPSSGKIVYAYMPQEIKDEVNSITKCLLENRDIKKEYAAYLDIATKISNTHSVLDQKKKIQKEKAKKDLEKRIGNIILKCANELRNSNINTIPSREENSIEEIPQTLSQNIESEVDLNTYNDDNYEMFSDFPHAHPTINNSKTPYKTWTNEYKHAKDLIYGTKYIKKDHDKAFSLMQKEANSNCLACFDIGMMYERGIGTNINMDTANYYYLKAFSMFKEMLTENNQDITNYFNYRIGKMYQYGIGIEQDLIKSIEYLSSPAKNGYQYAQYSLGKIYQSGKGIEHDFEKALDLYIKSAEKGNAFAAYDAATMLKSGTGCDMNSNLSNIYYQKAFNLFNKILEDNPNDYIQYRTGKMYATGEGTKKDLEKAKSLLKESATSKNITAMCQLLNMHVSETKGEINDNDCKSYINVLKELALMGVKSASSELAYLNTRLTIPMSEAVAMHYYKLSDDGNTYALGRHYAVTAKSVYQESVKKDNLKDNIEYINNLLKKSKSYLEKADQESSYTQLSLGNIYMFKGTSLYDKEKGVSYLEKSFNQGNISAAFTLGKHYYDELNVMLQNRPAQKDLKYEKELDKLFQKCVKYFEIDSSKSPYAQFILGKAYLIKNSSFYNRDKGISYLNRSVENGNKIAAYTLGKLYLSEAEKLSMNNYQRKLSPEESQQISEKCGLALKYLSKADSENAYSMMAITKTLLIEQSAYYNPGKGINILTKLANENNDSAQYQLGKLYLFGKTDIGRDESLGISWLRKASSNGNQYASDLLQSYQERQITGSIVNAYNLFLNVFNNITEANDYQDNIYSRMLSNDKSKAAIKENLLKQGKANKEHE